MQGLLLLVVAALLMTVAGLYAVLRPEKAFKPRWGEASVPLPGPARTRLLGFIILGCAAATWGMVVWGAIVYFS